MANNQSEALARTNAYERSVGSRITTSAEAAAQQQQALQGYSDKTITNPEGPSSSSTVITNNDINQKIQDGTDNANKIDPNIKSINSVISGYKSSGFDLNYNTIDGFMKSGYSLKDATAAAFNLSIAKQTQDTNQQSLNQQKSDQQAAYQADLAQSSAAYAQATSELNSQKEKDLNQAKTTTAALNPYSGPNTDENNYSSSINNEYTKLQQKLDSQAAMAKAALASGNYKANAAIEANMAQIKTQGLENIKNSIGDMQKASTQQNQFDATLNYKKTFDETNNYSDFLKTPELIPSEQQINSLTNEEIKGSAEYQKFGNGLTVDQFKKSLITASKYRDVKVNDLTSNTNLKNAEAQTKLDSLNRTLISDKDIRTTMGGNKYVDLSMFHGVDEYNKARDQAYAAGVVPLSANDVSVSQSIDSVKAGLQTIVEEMNNAGLSKKDSSGRITGYLPTKINKITQKNPTLAALFDSNGKLQLGVDIAVNSLRTIAGSSSFRMTAGEIDKQLSALPTANDTAETAAKKIEVMTKFLEGKEAGVFTADRSTIGNNNTQMLTSPDGTQQVNSSELTPAELKEAKDAGWK